MRYEYKTINSEEIPFGEQRDVAFNKLGSDGWEMFFVKSTMLPGKEICVYYFKRVLQ